MTKACRAILALCQLLPLVLFQVPSLKPLEVNGAGAFHLYQREGFYGKAVDGKKSMKAAGALKGGRPGQRCWKAC